MDTHQTSTLYKLFMCVYYFFLEASNGRRREMENKNGRRPSVRERERGTKMKY